jgi:hypothetical protein
MGPLPLPSSSWERQQPVTRQQHSLKYLRLYADKKAHRKPAEHALIH